MYPRVARAYSLYILCRSQQLLQVEIPKQKKTRFEIVPWPIGYGSLPDAGGVLDQDAYTMIMFDRFLAGERQAAIKRINK